ncbi:dentin sialophosphoprotein-like isoform X2 [Mya arenaria]|uniref:dentin sialophosphoprotein-like isoform X2 n=1 Tax=Mya arenaria TaxID=6604 RepID=UPI0022E5E47B|nr:dentin sialophosphoprotein-like isoform X2 [Mya arenaria]
MDVDNEMENEADQLSDAENLSEEDQSLADGNEIVKAAEVMEKRGRGRPRKQPVSPSPGEVKEKRGRGRPRKTEEMGIMDGEAPVKKARLDDQYKGGPVKKGRGRPRMKKQGPGRPRKVDKTASFVSNKHEKNGTSESTMQHKSEKRSEPERLRRSRPRLSYMEVNSDEEDMESGFESDQEDSPDSQGSSGAGGSSGTSKGRGRPKGSKGKRERKKLKEEDVESRFHQIEAQLFGPKSEKTKKVKVAGRGRGRPPSTTKKPVTERVPGRGRGRPPNPNKVEKVPVVSGRGRGRPKKNTHNAPVDKTDDSSVDSNSPSSPDMENSIDSDETPVINKGRGRGRPKKNTHNAPVDKRDDSSVDSISPSSPDMENSIDSDETPVTNKGRGRGRPKKNTQNAPVDKRDDSSVDSNSPSSPDMENSIDSDETPVTNKGRERPKKNTHNAPVGITDDSSVDSISPSSPDMENSIDSDETPVTNTSDTGNDIDTGNKLCSSKSRQQESQPIMNGTAGGDTRSEKPAFGSQTVSETGDVPCLSDSRPAMTGKCNTSIGPIDTALSIPSATDNVGEAGDKADVVCQPLFASCDIDSGHSVTPVIV